MGWTPKKHTVIKDSNLSEKIHRDGFAILDFISEEKVCELLAFYHAEHSLKSEKGGMFYSVYSKDLAYREKTHQHIYQVIKPAIDLLFKDYNNVINAFVVKASGPNSSFYLHQDTTALDEFKYSPLSIWIALQDTDATNGAVNIIPKTHWLFSPYRGVTIPFPFSKIQEAMKPYLMTIKLKAGQALVFDNRLVHNSSVNHSGKDRLAIVSGIFPKEASFITCYKDQSDQGNKIEMHAHDQDYLLKYPNFFYDCHDRPINSIMIDQIEDDFPAISSEQFEAFCAANGLQSQENYSREAAPVFNIISEPINQEVSVKTKWWKKLLGQ